MGAKTTEEYIPPPIPQGFESLEYAELVTSSLPNGCDSIQSPLTNYCSFVQGWINEDKLRRHGFPPGENSRVVVCGLPGVYDKLCGPRTDPALAPGSALYNLGYSSSMVVKL